MTVHTLNSESQTVAVLSEDEYRLKNTTWNGEWARCTKFGTTVEPLYNGHYWEHFVPCSKVSLTQGLPHTFSRHGSVKSSFEDNVAAFSELSLALRWQGVLSRGYYYELTPVAMVDNLARCLLNWDGFAYNWETVWKLFIIRSSGVSAIQGLFKYWSKRKDSLNFQDCPLYHGCPLLKGVC